MIRIYATEQEIQLFHQGNQFHTYRILGAHLTQENGKDGVCFTVWAPHAVEVRVAGDFNGWIGTNDRMDRTSDSGIWSLFLPDLGAGALYKYEIVTSSGEILLKADPYAFYSEVRPRTASVVQPLDTFEWTDKEWQTRSRRSKSYSRPMNIYEVHLGSWRNKGIEDFNTYEELADSLLNYVCEMGYTHIEMMPLGEHPYDGSWGYQTTGYYSVTSRYGTPEQFKYLVNRCHERGIGVILDWVPGHFCKDTHGLRQFDGQPLYEYEDFNKAEKPLWGTLSFDFSRPEVHSFLISNALFWMDVYHIDGLRVDAVASMMSYNFDKPPSMWTYNQYGGSENLDVEAFFRKLNEAVFARFPSALMIAEDSSDRPKITSPTYDGGLGFNYKWNMGWMNDMLRYMQLEPRERKNNHHLLTFSLFYAFSENYVLPFSHDEVVHGKKSLLNKMPGDYWQKFANYRLLCTYLMAHPGKKLLFMGGEFAQFIEWRDREQLDWLLFEYEMHRNFHGFIRELNRLYLEEGAFWEQDNSWDGFEWIDPDNAEQSVISFIRKGKARKNDLFVICNFTPTYYPVYRIGVPAKGEYEEVFNSDHSRFGGSGKINGDLLTSAAVPMHKRKQSIELSLPPLGAVILRRVKKDPQTAAEPGAIPSGAVPKKTQEH